MCGEVYIYVQRRLMADLGKKLRRSELSFQREADFAWGVLFVDCGKNSVARGRRSNMRVACRYNSNSVARRRRSNMRVACR